MSRINEHFTFAHEKLQDENLRKLALVDQMIVDFKADVPDPSLLKKILGNAAGGKQPRLAQGEGQ